MGEALNHTDVKVYPELNRVILKHGGSVPSRTYYLLRHVDRDRACGWVDLKEFMDGIGRFHGISKAKMRHALSHKDAAAFFDIDEEHGRVYIRSIAKVCYYYIDNYGERVQPGKPVYISLRCFPNLQRFKANLYASWFTEPKEISREKLTELFGASSQTQRNWEELSGVDKKFNWIICKEDEFDPSSKLLPRDKRNNKDDRSYTFNRKIDGTDYIAWQTVNTYKSNYKQGRVGQTRKIRKAAAARLNGLLNAGEAGDVTHNRAFFDVNEIPARPERVINEPCAVKMPGVVERSKTGTAQMWLYSPTTPVGKRHGLTTQETISIMNGNVFWNK